MFKSFQDELEFRNSFIISKYIRCPIDAGNCMNIIIDNFDIIKIYQKHMQFNSEKHPEIDWPRLFYHFDIINATSTVFTQEKDKVTRA